MNRKERRAAAKRDVGALVPNRPDSAVTQALRLHQEGRLGEAERQCREVLATEPRHAAALHLLGVIASQTGHHAAAVDLLERALLERPREAMFQNSLGVALQALGRTDEAIRQFKRAAAGPGFPPALLNLGLAFLVAGRSEEATQAAAAALAVAETPDARALFLQCLRINQDPEALQKVRSVVLRALRERWSRPSDLARSVCRLVAASALAPAVARSNAVWPERLVSAELDLASAAADELLHELLVSTPVCALELERYCTSIRAAYLAGALSPTTGDEMPVGLAAALARQCFINEYVFDCTAAEATQVELLQDSVNVALHAGEPIAPVQLAALASYAPLHALPTAAKLLDRPWPDAVKALLIQQVEEPAAERELRKSIPQLTAIEDSVSQAVQEQYEANPYPRWTEPRAVDPPRSIYAEARDVLVAGCGTGRHLIEIARMSRAARILAVDLSGASLAYAMRKAGEAALENIEFGQADILALGALGRTFDVIDASGVLHHMADPWAGWRVLVSLLRPGGAMRVALYSELARQPLAAARAFIAQRGYGSSTPEIRQFRQDALREPSLIWLAQSGDFYTISACRDLLFHVQEQRMTLPQIRAFLDDNGLTFLGFDLSTATLQAFRHRFPGDASLSDLECWHAFEQEHPFTFARMYQFDVRKV